MAAAWRSTLMTTSMPSPQSTRSCAGAPITGTMECTCALTQTAMALRAGTQTTSMSTRAASGLTFLGSRTLSTQVAPLCVCSILTREAAKMPHGMLCLCFTAGELLLISHASPQEACLKAWADLRLRLVRHRLIFWVYSIIIMYILHWVCREYPMTNFSVDNTSDSPAS